MVCPLGRARCCVRVWIGRTACGLMSIRLCIQIKEGSVASSSLNTEVSVLIVMTDSGLFCDPGPQMRPVSAGFMSE